MKHILLAILILTTTAAVAQVSDFNTSKDKETGWPIYKGQMQWSDLQTAKTMDWFSKGVKEYKPDSTADQYLKAHLKDYDLVIFMGTWCDDSHYLIPKVYKVLQQSGYPAEKILLYGVDRAKETKNGYENKLYAIKKVPTIIVMKNSIEIGRITESVKKSAEVDLVQIIKPQ